ncbi:hypothetical protein [Leifsonia sp. 2MCAF36]
MDVLILASIVVVVLAGISTLAYLRRIASATESASVGHSATDG